MKGNTPHIGIAGETGWGKSKMVQLILFSLCLQQTPANLHVYIVDLKAGVTFAEWTNAAHVKGVYTDTDTALDALQTVRDDMWRRLSLLFDAKAHFRPLPAFPELLLVIDEGGELSPAGAMDTDTRKEKMIRTRCMQLLSELVRIGREPGIHVIYATQRPDHNTLPVNIRSQLGARFCFKVKEEADSRIVLDHSGAELLTRPGQMIYQVGTFERTLQATFVPDDMIKKWLYGQWRGELIVDTTIVGVNTTAGAVGKGAVIAVPTDAGVWD